MLVRHSEPVSPADLCLMRDGEGLGPNIHFQLLRCVAVLETQDAPAFQGGLVKR